MYLLIFAIFIFIILKLKSPSIKGSVGEFHVAVRLKFLNAENYKVLNDVLLKNKSGRTSQIDHVIVSPYGIFVIETKNYKGWIFGNEKSENWTQVIYKKKYLFKNPVKRNLSLLFNSERIIKFRNC